MEAGTLRCVDDTCAGSELEWEAWLPPLWVPDEYTPELNCAFCGARGWLQQIVPARETPFAA